MENGVYTYTQRILTFLIFNFHELHKPVQRLKREAAQMPPHHGFPSLLTIVERSDI